MNKYDVLGIGNAIVDVLTRCGDDFIEKESLRKGGMTLVDEARAAGLYKTMQDVKECSGGSTANTLAALASLGGKTAFIGKVAEDVLGRSFRFDMRALGVTFDTPASSQGPATASCMIFVTPDAQRTMCTYLGACSLVSEEDIDPDLVGDASVLYIEGYLWDQPGAIAALRKAISIAKEKQKRVAFTLSDGFCVDRHRKDFQELIEKDLDILFANEQELKSLYETQDFDAAIEQLKGKCPIAVVTRSEKGAVLVTRNGVEVVPAEKVENVVDSTGAGDLFASGFLWGLIQGKSLKEAAQIGNRCAGHIITQMGARSLVPLHTLVA